MAKSTASVFSKAARNDFKEHVKKQLSALLASQEKLKNIVFDKKGYNLPRNEDDFIMSSILVKKELPFYSLKEGEGLAPFLNDLYSIPKEYRMNKVVCFDTETTSDMNAYAVSIALILFNIDEEKIEKSFYTLLNPGVEISYGAMEVHGITEADVKDERKFSEVSEEIRAIFNEADMVVGHNVEFDMKVIEKEYERIQEVNPILFTPSFDTMRMAKQIVQARNIKNQIKDPRLEEAVAFFEIDQPEEAYHNALVDTEMCLKVFRKLLLQ